MPTAKSSIGEMGDQEDGVAVTTATTVVNAAGKVVAPGLVDPTLTWFWRKP